MRPKGWTGLGEPGAERSYSWVIIEYGRRSLNAELKDAYLASHKALVVAERIEKESIAILSRLVLGLEAWRTLFSGRSARA